MKAQKRFLNEWQIILAMLLVSAMFHGCISFNKKPELSIITDKSPGEEVLYGLDKVTQTLDFKKINYEIVETLQEAQGKTVLIAGLSIGNGLASAIMKEQNHTIPETPEALTIWKTTHLNKPAWIIMGYDNIGLMYALLDVADRIRWNIDKKSPLNYVTEITEQPEVKRRAVSLYTMNRAYWENRFFDDSYWTSYLDMLAKNRFNSMVVIFGYENGGFLAPCYPYFFDVEGFPEVGMEITPEEQQRNLRALNHLIDMAHKRGIKFTVGIWDHIYRGGVQLGGITQKEEVAGKFEDHRVKGVNQDNLIAYTFSALEKFIRQVPKLDGIQFRMHDESGLKREEQDQFWLSVFMKMKETNPALRFDLRAKAMSESVIQSAIKVGMNFRITTKYWMEQMGLPFHPTHINRENQFDRRHGYADLLRYPQEYIMHWKLWTGGTTRILLWGDTEYVRRFAASTHLYNGEGFEVNEPLATKMEAQPHDEKPFDLLNPEHKYYNYEFERYWLFFQVFGRLGYNPDTPAEIWQKEFEAKFGLEASPIIEEAIHKASKVLPRIVASCYPYGCFPTTRGWPEKQRLGDLPAYAAAEGSDIQQFASFDTEAQLLIEGGETTKILPSQNSLWLEQLSAEIIELSKKAEKAIGQNRSKEYVSTITDLRILSNLALYHSRRIPAAVSYRIFEHTNDVSALEEAIRYEKNAIDAWQQIVEAAGEVYTNDLKMGVREARFMGIKHQMTGHWKDELTKLDEGLTKLEQQRDIDQVSVNVTSAPRYLKAELSDHTSLFEISHIPVTTAEEGKPIKIQIKTTAPAGIKWIRLRYRNVNQMQDYRIIEMLPAEEKDVYSVMVPSEDLNPKWDFMYFFELMDENGKGAIYPDLNKETPYYFVRISRE